ncbi:NAD-dependent epimerase/dehydratase family protein [Litchfieldia salsa]|uniref:Nucleoside-diphosphate-sugar epimerase n=1 Tax=Litchfieldia salsa TaxID=930152 RepID=A0A1H0S6V5_9BACI|nr:NAD(P)-dependent oxidoreductase [Litchfieldia salsa]SDP37503.1 Nucleoside-diphosphate-sugar epimerase [Litchfieldia salsa]
MKKAVVIGALGFVGYGLCCRLLDEGVLIEAMDLPPCDNSLEEEKILQIGRNANFRFIDMNIEDRYEQLSSDTDVIFFSLLDLNDNVEGSDALQRKVATEAELVKAIQACGQSEKSKIVIISSTELNEERKQGKSPIEQVVKDYVQSLPVHYSIIRLPMIYGPWQPNDRCFQRAINAEINNEEFVICSGDYSNDILYIDDAVNEIIKIVKEPEVIRTATLSSGMSNLWIEGLKLILKGKFEDLETERVEFDKRNENTSSKNNVRVAKTTSLSDGITNQYEYAKWLSNYNK